MKNVFLSAMILFAFTVSAHAERTQDASCTVESTGEQGVSRKDVDSVKWNQSHDNVVSYDFSFADGSQGQFSLMSVRGNDGPDSFDEYVSISGFSRDECKEENLFTENEKGESVWSGVETVCPNGTRHSVTVTCSF